ncbi:MAG: hypothetical protein PHT96_14835 [Syntrophorhabdaceae bacterium]|nr:hypothetical protein [Syntrophorhabdaceae bacterium]
MKRFMNRFNNNKGSMLVILIIAMTVIAALGAAFVSMVGSKQQGFTLLLNGHRATMIARAGVEWAIRFASEGNDVSGDKDFEEGSFSVSPNDTTDVLTVDGTYQGITQRITLSNFRRYLKLGDVSFPLSMASFKPVESQAGRSIAVEKTGIIHLGLQAQNTAGAVWYGGSGVAGNCVNGVCDFGSGFRAYFVFQFAPGSTGDGFTFAITSGDSNTASSVGGDTKMGELMAYGGDSRSYSGDYINSFLDGSGKGLRPPKFAVEFDIDPNTNCPSDTCGSNNRCDPSNQYQHMAYVFWGDDNRITCKDNYTKWMSSFSFLANTVVYGTTEGNTYLYRLKGDLTTGTTEPPWPTGKGSTVAESGVQWQEYSWRKSTDYTWDFTGVDVVAPSDSSDPTAVKGFFFLESRFGTWRTGTSEPTWANCVDPRVECKDNDARWQNAFYYGVPRVNYATNSRTYDDNRHTAGTGTNEGKSTGVGPTNTTSSDSYYSPANPTTWLADRANSSTVNRTYAYRMEVVRNSETRTYQIRSWIKTCDPPWSASTEYYINDLIRPTGNNAYYYIATTPGKSGATQPTWSTSGTVPDGTVTWTPVKIPDAWSASTAYAVGYVIRPTVNNGYYYTARTGGTSGATQPTWPASGIVTDGTVTWVPVQMTICNKYTNGTLGDVQSDYTADSPPLDRTITLDETYNYAFSKFLFGWTTASGGATQRADVWKFRMTFKP